MPAVNGAKLLMALSCSSAVPGPRRHVGSHLETKSLTSSFTGGFQVTLYARAWLLTLSAIDSSLDTYAQRMHPYVYENDA